MIDFRTVKQAARGRWPEILLALGIPSEVLTGKHGPCPGCGGRDRFRSLNDDNGGWICGQGGTPTGGDGLDLLCHVHGWRKGEALKAVAGYLGIAPDNSPKARQKVWRAAMGRAALAKGAQLEEALLHEITVLNIVLNARVSDRKLAADRKYRDAATWFRPMPREHWEREEQAASRVRKLLDKLYPERVLQPERMRLSA